MPGALLGVRSCGRCATDLSTRPDDRVCIGCGALRVAAASGSALGTYAGLLSGVQQAAPSRRRLSAAATVFPVIAVSAIVLSAMSGAFGDDVSARAGVPVVGVAALLGYGSATAVALRRRGRALGHLMFRLRTVDDLTGEPPRRLLEPREWAPGRRRHTVVADLRRGRDPLLPGTPPLDRSVLAPDRLGTAEDALRPASVTPRPADLVDRSPSVVLVLDTGERLSMDTTLLVGRLPSGTADDGHPVFPWPDLGRSLSKTHALLEWTGTVLWVTDLHSTNGSALVSPDGTLQPLVPGLRGPAAPGWTVRLGERRLEVHPSGVIVADPELPAGDRFVRGLASSTDATARRRDGR